MKNILSIGKRNISSDYHDFTIMMITYSRMKGFTACLPKSDTSYISDRVSL
jgi:hypothetical protein